MPSSDYTTPSSGVLKLKGGGIDKKKKKKKPKPASDDPSTSTELASTAQNAEKESQSAAVTPAPLSPSEIDKVGKKMKESGGREKTEAEKRHEERRRKRLNEKLKRDGLKTHKERVEELNRYLSGLSEHHDMPKIGPG
ncbi:DUF1754-domain-containing protein [Zopfia rhizophila CBS 207.26]|uniref:DUF1754-domain-containing protein n=1 Tax=Zopfia rhizophila CBS 207.26 TaxID=1314779 RepID=A0A6A6DQN6_9PEZI|nr:DUF1754-domain-containing protein [Zopfia rhizophila CBS 207.26]